MQIADGTSTYDSSLTSATFGLSDGNSLTYNFASAGDPGGLELKSSITSNANDTTILINHGNDTRSKFSITGLSNIYGLSTGDYTISVTNDTLITASDGTNNAGPERAINRIVFMKADGSTTTLNIKTEDPVALHFVVVPLTHKNELLLLQLLVVNVP